MVLWARILLIEYRRQFLGDDAQKDLADVLRSEAEGILAWIVRGAIEYFRIGLDVPDSVAVATAQFRADSDRMRLFFEESCLLGPKASVRAQDLWSAYDDIYIWVHDLHGKQRISNIEFGRMMGDRFDKVRRSDGFHYRGIGLNDETKRRLGERLAARSEATAGVY